MRSFWQKVTKSESKSLVINVLDGDTFVLETSQRVRLASLDAPEINWCGGQEAKEKLQSLVMGKKVILREPVVDNWGRIVALVYAESKFVNEELLKEGWGYYIPARFRGLTSDQMIEKAKEEYFSKSRS